MSQHNRERRRIRRLLKSGRVASTDLWPVCKLRLRKHGKQILAGKRSITLTRAEAASGMSVPGM